MKSTILMARCALLGLLLGAAGCGPATTQLAFPVTRVTMYDCGLAQWERETKVDGESQLEIPVTRAHLDDLLASLALATDGGVKVRSVRFPSVPTLSQAESASSLGQRMLKRREDGDGAPPTASAFARMLIGVPVRVQRTSGSELTGTLMGVTQESRPQAAGNGGVAAEGDELLVLMLRSGGMTWVPLTQVSGLFPLSEEEAVGMEELAESMGRSRGLDAMTVKLETTADSSGRLAAAHIRQSPLWRINYRVTAKQNTVLVEMWALVHNDSPEDWQDVNLTLLSGLPKSYVMSLASPRYAERDVMTWDESGSLSPQLGARTPDELVFGEEGYDGALAVAYASGAVGYGMGGGGGSSASVRMGSASVKVGGAKGLTGEGSSSLLEVGEPAAEETATAEVSKEISTYTAMLPVTIPHGTSGMVPLMRREMPGQAFGRVQENGGQVETCVRVENTSGLVLQGGTASFYIGGRFRGQELLERTQPGDVRVWCFGQDPDVGVSVSYDQSHEERILEWRNRQLLVHSVKRVVRTYSVTNEAGQERQMGLVIPVPSNGRLVAPLETVAGEGNERVFWTVVPARSEWTGEVVMELGVVAPAGTHSAQWKALLEAKSLGEAGKAVLRKALPVLEKQEGLNLRYAELQSEQNEWAETVTTIREDLRAIPTAAGSAVTAPLVKRLTEAEGEVRKLKEAGKALEKEIAGLAKRIEEILGEMPEPVKTKAK